jgi:hypothetical protein
VIGNRRAGELTALLTALLGFVMVTTQMAGNADGLLIYFETLALSAFLFAGDRFAGRIATAIGLAGATLVKVEGTVFCGCFLIACVLTTRAPRRWRTAFVIGVLPLLLLGIWVAFCRWNGLVDVYDIGRHRHVSLSYLPGVLRAVAAEASYGVWYAPWIALSALLVGGGRSRILRMPLLAASGFVAFMIYMYATLSADPREWIGWSAGRLLVTPLLCCFIGLIERPPESCSFMSRGISCALQRPHPGPLPGGEGGMLKTPVRDAGILTVKAAPAPRLFAAETLPP